jgi:hypothetical protein
MYAVYAKLIFHIVDYVLTQAYVQLVKEDIIYLTIVSVVFNVLEHFQHADFVIV